MYEEFWNLLIVYYAIFFLTSAYILYKLTSDIATKSELNAFRFIIVIYMTYLVVNLACTLQLNGVIYPPRSLCYVICFFALLTVILNGATLYHFIVTRFLMPLPFKRIYYYLFSIAPMAVMLSCMLASCWNGMIFVLDENNFIIYGPAYPILTYGSMLYFVAIIVILIYNFFKSRSYVRRQQVLTTLGAVLFLVVSIIVNTFFYVVTALPPALFVSIIIIYMNMQESIVHTDALTGMNNRRKANEYISGLIDNLSEEKPMYLYMCDVNSFKQINDCFGHNEGDNALILVSNALKSAVYDCDGFAARLGGDEFILSYLPHDIESDPPQKLIDSINNALSTACKSNEKPYTVSLSIGYALCTDPSRSLQDFIREADENLYMVKREFHKIGLINSVKRDS